MPPAEPISQRDTLDIAAVALTFDDGPSEWTEAILDHLGQADARATFFVIGDAIPGKEQILRRALAEGHELANHTQSHPRLDLLATVAEVERELRLGNGAIEDVAGTRPVLFRPPGFRYGQRELDVAGNLEFRWAVLASVAMADYRMSSAKRIAKKVVRRARPGAIITLHDGRSPHEPPHAEGGSLEDRTAVVDAVEIIVSTLAARGYTFCTVSELLSIQCEPGDPTAIFSARDDSDGVDGL
jgi:peptidoglycan/xylan/chitin deacetylase (PgdA/CDA1 family)